MPLKKTLPDLSVSFIGKRLPTPFLVAAGSQTTVIGEVRGHMAAMARFGWGGVVLKTVTLGGSFHVRPYLWSTGEYRLQGLQNSGTRWIPWKAGMLEELKRDVDAAHRRGLIILGSISGANAREWRELAGYMREGGVDGIELDVSCPSEALSTSRRMSPFLGSAEKRNARQVISHLRRVFPGPIMAKLSFHSADVAGLAKVCEEAGAAALSAINTIQGVIGIDIDSGVPVCSGSRKNSYRSGISGPIIKPFGLSVVSKICGASRLPVSGIGGISDWKGAVEYFMVGATTVQVCSAIMWHGFKLGQDLSRGLQEFMGRKGYRSLGEFRGAALPHFTSAVFHPQTVKASIDPQRCRRCGRCRIACRDGAYQAIRKQEGNFLVHRDLCDGCGLCRQVCPEQAIRLEALDGSERRAHR